MVRAAHFTEGETVKRRGVTPMWDRSAPFQVRGVAIRRENITPRLLPVGEEPPDPSPA
jgi:hypothetical protein